MSELSPEEKRALQLRELEIFDLFAEICKRHNLRYFIIAGTLLGAARHGGFIPWDDDMDIAMPRRDFNKFSKICKKELPEGYFFQSSNTEKSYPFFFSKLRRDGEEVNEEILSGFDIHKGCYIDIFPLDKCPRSEGGRKLMFKLVEIYSCALIAKLKADFVCEYQKGGARLLFSLAKHLPTRAVKALRASTRAIISAFCSGKTLATLSGTHGYTKEYYRREWYFEGEMTLVFEGRECPVPPGYEKQLTRMYGDYMTPPDESQRGGHFNK